MQILLIEEGLCESKRAGKKVHLAHEVDTEGEVVSVDERHDSRRLLDLRAPRKVLRVAYSKVTRRSERKIGIRR
jgi:hypothetical protein